MPRKILTTSHSSPPRISNTGKENNFFNLKKIRNVPFSLTMKNKPIYGSIIHVENQRKITKTIEEEYNFSNSTLNTGVCLSASIHYLIKSLVDKKDYWTWLSDSSAKWDVISQYLESDYSLTPPVEFQLRMQKLIIDWGLAHTGTSKLCEDEYNAQKLAKVLTQGELCPGRLCVLSKKHGQAHAFSIIKNEHGIIKLMDPNFGEMEFKDELEITHWILNIFEKKYIFFDNAHVNYYSLP